MIHHFIFVFFLYFSNPSSGREDQFTVLILKFGIEDLTDSGLLKTWLTLNGLSLWFCLQKGFGASQYTAISGKVVRKNVHGTIPKDNMGYDRYTVPGDCGCRTYFCCFLLALKNTFSCPFVPGNSFKFLRRTVNPKPPTMPFRIVTRTFSDNLSRNSCI